MKTLLGHTSFDTAYEIADYPHGFVLRCKKRIWVETHPKLGQRIVYQTSNPRRDNKTWNAPKKSTYATLCVLLLNPENNHVETYTKHVWGEDDLINFLSHGFTLDAYQQHWVERFKAAIQARNERLAASKQISI